MRTLAAVALLAALAGCTSNAMPPTFTDAQRGVSGPRANPGTNMIPGPVPGVVL